MHNGRQHGGSGWAVAVARVRRWAPLLLVASLLGVGFVGRASGGDTKAGTEGSTMATIATVAPVAASAAGGAADGSGVRQLRRGTQHDALYDIAFDGLRGVAVGAFGTVLATADGGATWAAQPFPLRKLALLSVAIKRGRCIAVGQSGIIFTADDCQTWKATAPVTPSRLLAVSVNGQGVAYAVGAFGTILRSGDWGKSWKALTVDWKGYTEDGAEPHLYDVQVGEDGTPTVVGEFELILRGNAAGDQWKALHKGERSLFGLAMLEDGSAYAVGQSGGVIASSDGGASWRSLSTGTQAILTGVHAAPNGVLIASGINTILVSKDKGASWTRLASKFVANGWHQALAAGRAADGKPRLLAVGSSGAILELD
jgi:photosystem II stability/assembly factor-like uncharacterized protein